MLSYEELIKNLKILMVDDDEDFVNIAYVYLKAKGYNIEVVNNGPEAIEIIKKEEHQIVLLDYFMPGMSGEEVVNEVRKFNQQVIIIMQTGFSGQKPPIETMQRLNIQNYHDKTEGMDKLNLELISAVKIFNQQNEISISKYKTNAIAKLINSIGCSIKSNLMSVSAGLEITNMMLKDSKENIKLENITKLNEFYENNKISLGKIDKILTSVMKEINSTGEDIMSDAEIIEVINLILFNETRSNNINLITKAALRTNTYITGKINDVIFVICEIITRMCKIDEKKSDIIFTLTEDEDNWYFIVEGNAVGLLNDNYRYILKNIIISIQNTSLQVLENSIKIIVKK
ncbi:MAG: response regulator [Clostridia bacterium]